MTEDLRDRIWGRLSHTVGYDEAPVMNRRGFLQIVSAPPRAVPVDHVIE